MSAPTRGMLASPWVTMTFGLLLPHTLPARVYSPLIKTSITFTPHSSSETGSIPGWPHRGSSILARPLARHQPRAKDPDGALVGSARDIEEEKVQGAGIDLVSWICSASVRNLSANFIRRTRGVNKTGIR